MKNIDERVREAQRAYFKEWRSKNKDKVKQHNINYWRKKAEQKAQESKTNLVIQERGDLQA